MVGKKTDAIKKGCSTQSIFSLAPRGGKKRWVFESVFASIRGDKNRMIFLTILLKLGRFGLPNTVRLLNFLCWQ